MTLDKKYSYDGPGDGGEKLGLKVTIELTPPENPALAIKIIEQDGKGSFLFDNVAGRVATSNVTEKIKMSISVQNQQIEQSTETTSVTKLIPPRQAGSPPGAARHSAHPPRRLPEASGSRADLALPGCRNPAPTVAFRPAAWRFAALTRDRAS
jgi:hypothetical protein